ncbi:hypothetical protein WH50_18175 [Pokkaliibacter plantistimulans]|uniref:DUF962 domain-containing protein n=2 Tax=Pseudomonadota TaxID=1224 RepID=A0ABX5LW90_9GAMM|nr:Mpo1-like protein [Pokkaliibacter plantistimulans]PPC75912.1 hypothetical protein C4K68_18065 [Pokkaliibacter plantistimulans]PXF29885.1 hypothetical protein WH50_18175 [Pokkaliibacter plantistimulans]
MRSLTQWMSLYGESHQHPTNKLIHWMAVPGIFFCVVALLWSLPTPWQQTEMNWATLATLPAALFYLRLSRPLGIAMCLFMGMCLMLCHWLSATAPLLYVATGLFVVLWIAQFVGHAVEGKRPSFFTDLQFLLIGPAWLMQRILRQLRIPT